MILLPWENRKIDVFFIVVVAILMVFGIFILKSAVQPRNMIHLLKRQILWDILGFSVMMSILLIKEEYIKSWIVPFYIFSIGLLILVLFFGPTVGGAKRWFKLPFGSFQPSDLAKIAVVLALSRVLAKGTGFLTFINSLIVAGIPLFLILLEPDLGTSLLFGIIWLTMCFSSKIKKRYVIYTLVFIFVIAPFFYFFGLEDYQRERILAYLNPKAYSTDASYNVLQSIHAIGSGGIFGKGYMRGPANLKKYVPVAHTDFVVSVLGEELGFVGISSLIALYSLLFYRIYRSISYVKSEFWELVLVGVSTVLWFHVFENVGMCMGLMPVTGIPLPFISYGGTSTVTFSILLGLSLKGIALSKVERI